MSMPFHNRELTLTNPDGSEIQVRGSGDQFHAVFETPDGYTVTKDPETGFYQYARLSDSGDELIPTGVNVNGATPATELGLEPGLRLPPAAAKEQALARAAAGPQRRWQQRRRQKLAELREVSPLSRAEAAPAPAGTVGTYVGLCLLIEFPDVPATIPQTEVDNYCNQVGYSGFGNNGSVRDYFADVSDGKLTYTNVVTAYYTAAHNRSHYTDPAIPYGTRARELIVEALDHLVASGFDFSTLSADTGGFIYALNVFYAQSNVNNWSEGLWPHSWALAAPYAVAGGKKFNDYQFTDMGAQLTLGTFCHENGHMICDMPDLYDYGNQSLGAGHYSLMAFGGSDEKNPVQVDAYLKNEAGWATKLTPVGPGTSTINAGQNDFYLHELSPTEYFIIENRQQVGRDASLPDAGLAIWHVDEAGSNNNEQMTAALHYECSIEQADGLFHLEHKVNAGDAQDLFGGPGAPRFGADTTPDSSWWNGAASGLTIADISAPGMTMTFTTGDVELVVGNFGYVAGSWRVDRHPRFMADTTGDGRADIVGFGDVGVYVSRAQANGSFSQPQLVVGNYAYLAGGWDVERHPRFMADTTGDGRADIVGFGDAGVYVSRAQANGSFGI
jgi:M6 family metalloprotease-like protein